MSFKIKTSPNQDVISIHFRHSQMEGQLDRRSPEKFEATHTKQVVQNKTNKPRTHAISCHPFGHSLCPASLVKDSAVTGVAARTEAVRGISWHCEVVQPNISG